MTTTSYNLPDFLIIGAMKCATTTLHRQLESQPGIFMTTPKEPNFFSDDDVYAQGEAWYSSLFENAKDGELKGESSTHYTKLPTHPDTIKRMKQYGLVAPKMIYMIRHPIDRLVSQYMHEWTLRNISEDINTAIKNFPELVEYSLYNKQLSHFLEHYPEEDILILFFDGVAHNRDSLLKTACDFIGWQGENPPKWNDERSNENSSSMRWRQFPLSDILVESEFMTRIRRAIVPQFIRTRLKESIMMTEKPVISDENLAYLEETFNKDLASLGERFNVELSCENFKSFGKSHHLSFREI